MLPIITSYAIDTKKTPEMGSFLIKARMSLLKFDGSAGSFELGLGVLGVSLGDVFFDGLGGTINESFGFGEAETGDLANGLDDVDLLVASGGQHYGEAGLLFGGR